MFIKKYFPIFQYINIPNTITTVGLCFGVAACYFLVAGNLKGILVCLSLAMLMDFFDGFFAGKLNSRTTFGQSLDSLVDFFVCCVMPVLMVFTFVGSGLPLIIAAAFYCACGLWRLSYYNITAAEKRSYFTGMPVPGAALFAAMAIWSVSYYELSTWLMVAVLVFAGSLMVSFIKLKKYGLWQKALWVIGVVFLIVAIVL